MLYRINYIALSKIYMYRIMYLLIVDLSFIPKVFRTAYATPNEFYQVMYLLICIGRCCIKWIILSSLFINYRFAQKVIRFLDAIPNELYRIMYLLILDLSICSKKCYVRRFYIYIYQSDLYLSYVFIDHKFVARIKVFCFIAALPNELYRTTYLLIVYLFR